MIQIIIRSNINSLFKKYNIEPQHYLEAGSLSFRNKENDIYYLSFDGQKQTCRNNHLLDNIDQIIFTIEPSSDIYIEFGNETITKKEFFQELFSHQLSLYGLYLYLTEEGINLSDSFFKELYFEFEEITIYEGDTHWEHFGKDIVIEDWRNNEYYSNAPLKMPIERQLAIQILEALPQTNKLKNEKWYEAEDQITNILEKYYIKPIK